MLQVLALALLFSVLNDGITTAAASDDGDFFHDCPPSRCSEEGPEIRFPFRHATSHPSCGAPGMELSCSREAETILLHSTIGLCKVTTIDYRHSLLNVIPLEESWTQCPIQKIISSTNLSTNVYKPITYDTASLISCSRDFLPDKKVSVASSREDNIVGPIHCLSNTSQSMYLMHSRQYISLLPYGCTVVSNSISVPNQLNRIPVLYQFSPRDDDSYFSEAAKRIITFAETTLTWSVPNITSICQGCEREQRLCGFSSRHNQAFCKPHGSQVRIIAATSSVSTFIVLLSMVATALYLSLRSKNDDEVHLKVELFLKAYGTSKATRYTFSETKRIASRFKEKLGQGGFGSVYKGQLPNGVPVAVKMLENSNENGEEFINEVVTIGRIHHANVVRLFGFCYEGKRHALIYEFMPNGSLDKYIFLQEPGICREVLAPMKMLEIALGVARGVKYLHQGCDRRILHLDIKPHNILLDYSFNPKVSDFGLAKLCARDQSIITLTAGRGTMGYVAPELYCRSFGTVSCKSDVYSFGILLMEMVSGRRNSDPRIGDHNEVCIPEWIYEKIVTGQELEFTREMTEVEKESIRKLAIVALWCNQWDPANRPSMAEVVDMLTDRMQTLKMPPKPFVSSRGHQT
ncbi:unnamed protein product [Urochloa humidicola]